MSEHEQVQHSPLGQKTVYANRYDPSLLYPIQRDLNWEARGIKRSSLPFRGVDIWNKAQEVQARMQADLSAAAGAPVEVTLTPLSAASPLGQLRGVCLDELPLQVEHYTPAPELLQASGPVVEETLYSHLLKSNCPVTGQPDWGSVQIRYKGARLDHKGLLAYIISYREHGDFHEQCVENIFMDIWQRCRPQKLSVYARYVRRGGLDINPYRSSINDQPDNLRLSRQ